MRHFIHIRSYAADFEWLSYCLRSLDKFATGFERQLTLEVPKDDLVLLGKAHSICHFDINVVNRRRFTTDDYLGQQISKMTADRVVCAPGQPTDTITHFDSDLFVTEPISPADFFVGPAPLVYMTPYSKLPPAPEMPWKAITEEILGVEVTHEFMRRHPFTFPRWFYAEMRSNIERVHQKQFIRVISDRPYRSCSEFNLMSAFAWLHCPKDFHFVDTESAPLPKLKVDQAWSHGGIKAERRDWMEEILNKPL